MSSIQPVEPSSSSQDEQSNVFPKNVKQGLKTCAKSLTKAINQIKQSKDTKNPLPREAADQLNQIAQQLEELVPQINDVQIQQNITNAMQQIQVVVQNPEEQIDPAGNLTQAYTTITEAAQD